MEILRQVSSGTCQIQRAATTFISNVGSEEIIEERKQWTLDGHLLGHFQRRCEENLRCCDNVMELRAVELRWRYCEVYEGFLNFFFKICFVFV
ncbi:DUF19 domain-containing protein [Caenorhabditis elegans]|uniref:DUF19 domain-containing protein n=1 Tax=Caenorhabditis elegans TaxID=6239 RepID=Q22526_CAEEL|nr:DUF19 domain-containing protein [Caenorhabditis elegans]CCD68011.1 DUF19 domain-containing protein [Caenorhabditis elegans]|eukprot:NP_494985.1 Uncharacterized protein CELE_T16D1.1 [Caenorhabditis elegans]